jgi:hypothetical protein
VEYTSHTGGVEGKKKRCDDSIKEKTRKKNPHRLGAHSTTVGVKNHNTTILFYTTHRRRKVFCPQYHLSSSFNLTTPRREKRKEKKKKLKKKKQENKNLKAIEQLDALVRYARRRRRRGPRCKQ